MARTIYRYEVPVDDRPHTHGLSGNPVAVAGTDYVVEFWAETNPNRPPTERAFLVVGTGHPIPDDAIYVGTAPRTPHGLVWHLYEVTQRPTTILTAELAGETPVVAHLGPGIAVGGTLVRHVDAGHALVRLDGEFITVDTTALEPCERSRP
jgi:hypothetical protein